MSSLERVRAAIGRHRRASKALLVIALLGLESYWFFRDHYSGTTTFPNDFSATYHAVPFYWQAVVRAGHFPAWVPYQAFGYPLALNLQSSLFYPPLWVFPIVGATYTIRAAAILQCVHVFVGGLGAFAFARARKLAFSAALVSGFAYSRRYSRTTLGFCRATSRCGRCSSRFRCCSVCSCCGAET